MLPIAKIESPPMNDLYECAIYLHHELTKSKVPYYFLGGFACINVAMTARTTADIDIAVPNGQNGFGVLLEIFQRPPFIQDTEGVLPQDSYFFFVQSSGRFVEVDGVLAGFMAFPKIEDASMIRLQNLELNFLNPIGLMELKLSSWPSEVRRNGKKRDGDMTDIMSIRDVLIKNGERMALKNLQGDAANGLEHWIKEFKDKRTWKLLDPSYKPKRSWL